MIRLRSSGVCSQFRLTTAEACVRTKIKNDAEIADLLVEQGLMRRHEHTPGVEHEVIEDQFRVHQGRNHMLILTAGDLGWLEADLLLAEEVADIAGDGLVESDAAGIRQQRMHHKAAPELVALVIAQVAGELQQPGILDAAASHHIAAPPEL